MSISLSDIVSIGIYNVQIAQPHVKETKKRKTTMFEIELPIAEGGMSFIDGESVPISPQMLICAKPGQMRNTRAPFKCYYIHMILHEGDLYDVLMRLPTFIFFEDATPFRRIFYKMCEHYEKKAPEHQLILHSLILELVYRLQRLAPYTGKRHRGKKNNAEAIEDAIAYVRQNLTRPLSLKELADRASFSTVYFHKLFKASTGKTLHDYIEEQRIQKAIDMLLSSEATLADIAYECGFSSQSYFSYAFKRKMGMTPRVYAQKVMEQYGEEGEAF